MIKVGADITNFSRNMKAASAGLAGFQKANKETFDSFKKVGTVVTGAGIAVATGLGIAVKTAADFETAFYGVRKTVDMTEAEFEVLRQGIRNMSKELPASAVEIANVAESAGQLGIEKDKILAFTRTMIDLGVATNMTSETAATALARFANITNMSQGNFDRLGSTVVDLGNKFATTEEEIVSMALRLAGAGSQIGLSESDIMGLSAALSSVGIRAEMGGSAISKAMVMMQVATSTGHTKMQQVIRETGHTLRELEMMASHDSEGFGAMAQSLGMTKKELNGLIKSGSDLENFSKISGMTSEQFVQAFEKDAIGAIGAFINGLGNAEEAGESAINMLEEMGISEIRLRDALLRAGNASELFAESVDIANNAWDENIALTDEAGERYKTFESKLAMFMNVIKDLGITIGDVLLPALIKMMEYATKIIEWIGRLNPKLIEAGVIFTAISTAIMLVIGPMLLLIGFIPQIIGGFQALKTVVEFTGKGFKKFGGFLSRLLKPTTLLRGGMRLLGRAIGILTGPIGWVILILAELALVFVKLFKTNEEFRKRITGTWDAIVSKTREATAAFVRVVGPAFAQVRDAVLRIVTVIRDGVTKAFGSMSKTGAKIWGNFGEFIVKSLDKMQAVWNRVWPTMEKVFLFAWGNFQTALEIGTKLIVGLLDSIALLLSGDFTGAWKLALSSAKTAISEIVKILESLGKVVASVAIYLFDKAKEEIRKKMAEWATIIGTKMNDVRTVIIDKLAEWSDAIIGWAAGIPPKIKEKLSSWTLAFGKWMASQKDRFIRGLAEWSSAILRWIKSLPKKISNALESWSKSVESWTEDQNKENIRQFSLWGGSIIKWFSSMPSKIAKALLSWSTAITSWFTKTVKSFVGKFAEWSGVITAWFVSIPGIITDKLVGWSVAFSTWFTETRSLIIEKMAEWREAVIGWLASIPGLIKEKLLEWTLALGTWFDNIKNSITEWLVGWFTAIATWFTDTKSNIISKLAEWTSAFSTWFIEMPVNIGVWLGTWWTKFSTWMSEIPAKITKKLVEWWKAIKDWFTSVPDKPEIKNAGKKMIDKLAEGTKEKEPEFMEKLGKLILSVIAAVLVAVAVAFIAAGRELIKMIIQGIQNQKEELVRKATAVIVAAKRAISKIDLVQVGKDLIAGLIRGITSKINDVVTAAGRVASAVKNKITGYFQVKSPSRLMMGIGVNLIEGLANGMLVMRSAISRTATELAEAATVKPDLSYATPNANYGSLSAALSGEVNVNQRDSMLVGAIQSLEDKLTNLTVEMDSQKVGSIVRPHVNSGNAVDDVTRYF